LAERLWWDVGGDGRWPRAGVRAGRYSDGGFVFELVEQLEGFLDRACGGLTTRTPRPEPLWLSFREPLGKSSGGCERVWGFDSDGGFRVSGAGSVGIGSSADSCLLWVDMWLSIPPPAPWSLIVASPEAIARLGGRRFWWVSVRVWCFECCSDQKSRSTAREPQYELVLRCNIKNGCRVPVFRSSRSGVWWECWRAQAARSTQCRTTTGWA